MHPFVCCYNPWATGRKPIISNPLKITLVTAIAVAAAAPYAYSRFKSAHRNHNSESAVTPNGDQVRPVPEFARVARVVLPAGLFDFNYHADQLAAAVRAAGADVVIAGNGENTETSAPATVIADHTNIWLRDYSPLPVVKGSRTWLHGFNYASKDQVNNEFAARLAGELGIGFESSGLSLEGGNFLTDGSRCYIAGPIDERDTKVPVPSLAEARQHLGCRDLIVIANPPHVHIDMFAKILSADTVAINELDEAALDLIREPDGDIPEDIGLLKNALDDAARQFGQYLRIVRIPMPLPFKNTFRTYANAILVNGTAIIPSYEQYGWGYGSYPDATILEAIQERAAEVYRQQGYRTTFVNADGLIYNGGAFHCVSAHIPESVLTISDKGKN